MHGRGGEIRTHDLYVPNVALYQAKLRPDKHISSLQNAGSKEILSGEEQKENAGRPWVHQQGENQTFNPKRTT
jgi:hypothetical protein